VWDRRGAFNHLLTVLHHCKFNDGNYPENEWEIDSMFCK
jgi:hypothetical protein